MFAGLSFTACSGAYVGSGNGDDPAAAARATFEAQVRPMLEQNCLACHAVASGGAGPGILASPMYDTLKTLPGMITGQDPSKSRFYTYGQSPNHTGPEFTADQAELVRQWIMAEPMPAGTGDPGSTTDKFTPVVGANTIDLSMIAMGLTGATLTFTGERLATGLYLSDLKVTAGASGVHLKHPLFVAWTPAEKPDPVDSFNGVEATINPGETAQLGTGTLVFEGVGADVKLSVHFEKLESGMTGPGGGMDGGVVSGGCTNVTGFTTNAKPPLTAMCTSCHGGANSGATNSLSMAQLGDTSPTGQAAACGQIKGSMNPQMPNMSILFLRVAPGQMTGHPFTITDAGQYQAFMTSVLAWFGTEK